MPLDKFTQAALEEIESSTVEIPPPQVNKGWRVWLNNIDARSQLERDASQSHNIRRLAAYGALGIAFLLYGFGLYVIWHMVGLAGSHNRFTADMWHIATVVILALFSVPTALVIAVLRIAVKSDKQEGFSAVSPHEWVGKTIVDAVEKLVNKI